MPDLPNPFMTGEVDHTSRPWWESPVPLPPPPAEWTADAHIRINRTRLRVAREALLDARTNLALVRKRSDLGPLSRRLAEINFLAALDRAWDAQCMVDPCSR